MARTKEQIIHTIAKRVAKDFKDGDVINLGIGIPTAASSYILQAANVILQSENGILKIGEALQSQPSDEIPQVINANWQPASVLDGGMFFDSSFSFGLIRGGHVDATVLGALEVDEQGNLANWIIPGKLVPGMGGAMDLVNGAKKVIILMEHTDKNGNSKLKKRCSLPLTGLRVVHRVITELGVFDFEDGHMKLVELQPGVSLEELRANTEASFAIALD